MIYIYISVYFSIIYYSHIVLSKNILDSEEYPETLTEFINNLSPDSLNFYLTNFLHFRNDETIDDKNMVEQHIGKSHSKDSNKVLPVLNDMSLIIIEPEIYKFIDSTNFYWKCEIASNSDNYLSFINLYILSLILMVHPQKCEFSDLNDTSLKWKAKALKNYMKLKDDMPTEDIMNFMIDFRYHYNNVNSIPSEYTERLYSINSDCSRFMLYQNPCQRYFDSLSTITTTENLIGRIRALCPIVQTFLETQHEYIRMVYSQDVTRILDQIAVRQLDPKNLFRMFPFRITINSWIMAQNPDVSAFITNNKHGIDYISCRFRNIFNVGYTNKDYLDGIGILKSLLNTKVQALNSIDVKNTSITNNRNQRQIII